MHLKAHGEGQVSFVMTMDNRCREIGVMPADRCKISPRTVSAQKAAPGVIDVALV